MHAEDVGSMGSGSRSTNSLGVENEGDGGCTGVDITGATEMVGSVK